MIELQDFPKKSNCLLGALLIMWRFGGRLRWRPGWDRAGWYGPYHRWYGFIDNPWGHFRVQLGNKMLSYSSLNTGKHKYQFDKHPVLRQLWFAGYVKCTELKEENDD